MAHYKQAESEDIVKIQTNKYITIWPQKIHSST